MMSSSINFKRLENQFSTHRSNMEQKKFDDYLKSLNTFLFEHEGLELLV